MATELQIQANRANAAKSTGPVTPEGKRASSRNALTHGLHSSTVLLKGESTRRFHALAAALLEQFQPRNPAETLLVQTMLVAQWRLQRVWRMQTVSLKAEMASQEAYLANDDEPIPSPKSGAILATAFRHLADNSHGLGLQHRFEATYDRQFKNALEMLMKLRQKEPFEALSANPPGTENLT